MGFVSLIGKSTPWPVCQEFKVNMRIGDIVKGVILSHNSTHCNHGIDTIHIPVQHVCPLYMLFV